MKTINNVLILDSDDLNRSGYNKLKNNQDLSDLTFNDFYFNDPMIHARRDYVFFKSKHGNKLHILKNRGLE